MVHNKAQINGRVGASMHTMNRAVRTAVQLLEDELRGHFGLSCHCKFKVMLRVRKHEEKTDFSHQSVLAYNLKEP